MPAATERRVLRRCPILADEIRKILETTLQRGCKGFQLLVRIRASYVQFFCSACDPFSQSFRPYCAVCLCRKRLLQINNLLLSTRELSSGVGFPIFGI